MGNNFSNKIQELMVKQAITPVELADKTGLSRTMIYHYINGRSAPDRTKLSKFAEILGCDEKELAIEIMKDWKEKRDKKRNK